jgi:hypothetical protein
MKIDTRAGQRCPVITHEDSPDLVYAAVRDLHHYKRLGMAIREDVDDGLGRMRTYFDIGSMGELLKEPNPKLPGLTIYISVNDLELALVGLGCFTLDHRQDQVAETIPKVDELLIKIDALRVTA